MAKPKNGKQTNTTRLKEIQASITSIQAGVEAIARKLGLRTK